MKTECKLFGKLGNTYNSAINELIYGKNPQIHADAYTGEHDFGFAEIEFAGKYLDTCVRVAVTDKDEKRAEKAFQDAKIVVRSIIMNQREDGYIGGLRVGCEKEWFSVWNQAFTIIGLCSYREAFPRDTLSEAALEAARKSARYNASIFMNDTSIMNGGNNGSQHLALLLGLTRVYKLTKDERIHDFILHFVGCVESSDNNFFSFDSILDLRSKKGIENFVILIGMLEYGDLFDDLSALAACEKYWDELAETQIRKNGNGTVHEVWTDGGNKPRLVGLDENPDENCVAVGWIELSLALYQRKGGKKYIDAVREKRLQPPPRRALRGRNRLRVLSAELRTKNHKDYRRVLPVLPLPRVLHRQPAAAAHVQTRRGHARVDALHRLRILGRRRENMRKVHIPVREQSGDKSRENRHFAEDAQAQDAGQRRNVCAY